MGAGLCWIVFGFLLSSVPLRPVKAGFLKNNYAATVIEDTKLNTLQLLRKYNYPSESHYVTTEDKYILNMFRIPRPGAKPVLLLHGLEDSSDTWIFTGPQTALGYYLYDEGYDVWLGNARGNYYSRNHSTIDASERPFWRFSWHEIGYYDLAALIDTVLAKTGYSKLTYFGHSQGTTAFFVLASMRPGYNAKINIMHALAPVAFMDNLKSPLKSLAQSIANINTDPQMEFLPRSNLILRHCFSSQIALDSCLYYLWNLVGKDPKQMNMTMLPVILGHFPAGCSFKQIKHYLQLIGTQRFSQYDYGARENLERYGRSTPPSYPLEKISAPIGLYYTYNDYLTSEVDVQRLAKLLPNVVENCLYPYKKWNHVTMAWGIDARELAHKRMLELTRIYEHNDVGGGKHEPMPVDSKIPAVDDAVDESTSSSTAMLDA